MMNTRSGVSLVETLVAVALVLLMAAAFLPNLAASSDRARVEHAAIVLEEVMDAMTRMRFDNQDWPGKPSHLAFPITTQDRNACGSFYNTGRVNNWDGPYLDRPVPASGLPIGIGIVRDSIGRVVLSGGGGGQISHLMLLIDNVPHEDARELNRLVDADTDSLAGTIRWDGLDASGLVTVEWVRTVKGC